MVDVVSEFFQLMDLESVPPETLGELIPYLFHFVVSVALVSGVFAAVGKIASVFLNCKRF